GFYLRRIRALNPRLHAVIETSPGATADAAASDARRAAHGGRGPLEGIPVLLKDNIDTADRQHTTAGSFALVDSTPAWDACLVSRSGVIPISAKQDTAGPITRNVTDAAVVLTAIQGVDPGDPATAAAGPFAGRDYLTALDPNGLRGKRIGVWRAPAGSNADAIRIINAAVA